MCWTFEVSLGFTVLEAITTSFIGWRAMNSKDPYIRGQIYVLPLLISIVLIEFCEALLWLDEGLVSVDASVLDEPRPCSIYNQRITSVLYLFLLPFQPLFYMIPCRRVGDPRNRVLFAAPEGVAMATIFLVWYLYVYKTMLQIWVDDPEKYPTDFTTEPTFRQSIQRSGYKVFMNSETCSYIGKYHHLFWTYNTSDPYVGPTGASTFVPHGSTYFLVAFTVIYARPWKFCSAIFFTMGWIYFAQWHWFHASYESTSVWCWSGIVCNTYHLLQPYILPPTEDDYAHYKNYNKQQQTTTTTTKTTTAAATTTTTTNPLLSDKDKIAPMPLLNGHSVEEEKKE